MGKIVSMVVIPKHESHIPLHIISINPAKKNNLLLVYCGRGSPSSDMIGMAYVGSNRNRYISKVNYIYFSVDRSMYSSARGEC